MNKDFFKGLCVGILLITISLIFSLLILKINISAIDLLINDKNVMKCISEFE